jgi:hypothetical protein
MLNLAVRTVTAGLFFQLNAIHAVYMMLLRRNFQDAPVFLAN